MGDSSQPSHRAGGWITRTVLGIVLATFFSDFSHEMATAVLPLYLATVGLGPAALGIIEGLADFLVSVSKLGGGFLGHYVQRKRPWLSLGYLGTALSTGAMALVGNLPGLVCLRGTAWVCRGVRSPLRDFLLADSVQSTHYGRAYGLERAGDMFGAVAGPLVAALLVWGSCGFRTILLVTLLPGLVAASAAYFLTKEREQPRRSASATSPTAAARPRFPKAFWLLLVGVALFGLGDFSRTFLVLLAARGLGGEAAPAMGTLSVAVLLYAMHNLVSAGAAFPVGQLGDRYSKLRVLVAGYALGVVTNLALAVLGGSLPWLVVAIVLSGVYIAVEETLEKAAVAELLPRELRSLGFGILACVNAAGDMASSIYVGFLWEAGRASLAFGIAAVSGTLGVAWIVWMLGRKTRPESAEDRI